jgi:hypothetical protein
MNGRKLYVSPATTAVPDAVSDSPGGRMCSVCSVLVTGPESASTCRQAIVRRMNEVKNGAITAISMRLRQRPAFSAIAYASG